jgi:MoaA/NifB/PqqE/SkfB family radical SAM enzyme
MSIVDRVKLKLNVVNENLQSPGEVVKSYNATRSFFNRDSFCYAPSVNMLFSQDGSVRVCCHNTTYIIGRYPEQDLLTIWNGAQAEQLREKMRQYDLSGGCDVCRADFLGGHFEEVRARHFDTLPRNNGFPAMMEFLLTNLCNLECVMCQGTFSSLIRKNREKLPPIHSPYDENFMAQLKPFIPHLKEVRFSGSGEAFMVDLNYKIWEMIIEMNPGCLIMVQTNGTILTDRVKQVLEKGNFQIGISLDSLEKKTFEEIRINANFDKVMQNVEFFHQYSVKRRKKFMLSMCVMRQNWQEMPALIRLCDQLGAVATFHKVWYPKEYALYNLPSQEIQHIYQTLSVESFPESNRIEKLNADHYKYFMSVIHKWHEDAPILERRAALSQNLSEEELYPFIHSIIKAYYADNFSKLNAEERVMSAMSKLNMLIDLFENKDDKIRLLRYVCAIPPAEVSVALADLPLEVLFQEAGNHI